jgi:hypothetical protein
VDELRGGFIERWQVECYGRERCMVKIKGYWVVGGREGDLEKEGEEEERKEEGTYRIIKAVLSFGN